MNHVYHLARVQYSAGEACILAGLWLTSDKRKALNILAEQETSWDTISVTKRCLQTKALNAATTQQAQEHAKSQCYQLQNC